MDGSRSVMDQQYFDAAIRAVNEKKPVPEIDFTLVISTTRRKFVG